MLLRDATNYKVPAPDQHIIDEGLYPGNWGRWKPGERMNVELSDPVPADADLSPSLQPDSK